MDLITLKGEHIKLRALEPEDLDFLTRLENDESIWEISLTQAPYSKYLLKQYIDNSHKDIYEVKQLRLVVCNLNDAVLGFVDFFDFDPKNKRIGLGIIIHDPGQRNKGYASEVLRLIINYAFSHLEVHQIFANISIDNIPSISLFEKMGFIEVGVKKDWNLVRGKYKDELLYQLINHVH